MLYGLAPNIQSALEALSKAIVESREHTKRRIEANSAPRGTTDVSKRWWAHLGNSEYQCFRHGHTLHLFIVASCTETVANLAISKST